MTTANQVCLKYLGEYEEAPAGEAGIMPGMGLSLATDAEVLKAAATTAELAKAAPLIALEDGLSGGTIDTVYVIHNVVPYRVMTPGEQYAVLLKDGQVIVIGDNVVREGGGTGLWIKAAGTESKYAVKATEALSPSGANGRLAVQVV